MGKNADNSKEGQPIKDYGVEDVVDLIAYSVKGAKKELDRREYRNA